MPRKQNTQSENFNKPFPKALRKLMDANGTTQSELAASLQKTRQVISCYCDGSTSPTWETIAGIANFYHVSADWLLGLSDVRSTDAHIRELWKLRFILSLMHESGLNFVFVIFNVWRYYHKAECAKNGLLAHCGRFTRL